MKIKTLDLPYSEVKKLSSPKHKFPKRPNWFFRTLVRVAAQSDLKEADFSHTCDDKVRNITEPCLILMNHSSFIDLEIVSKIFYPKPYCIVTTSDGFVGKEWLMRNLGCIPTQKFVTDLTLIRDMKYALKEQNCSVLMYPEASYSFDGTATALPEGLSRLFKMLDSPVIMINTYGAFTRDPLYNCLQKRKVKVSAHARLLFDREQIRNTEAPELEKVLTEAFTFDNFRWQKENGVKASEPFRADGLERMLFRCPSCNHEDCMQGKGTKLVCEHCKKGYTLDEYGELSADEGITEFSHIPDWYAWERDCVRKEITEGNYSLDIEVDIKMLVDYKAIYSVGEGRLIHNFEGFCLVGCNGDLNYSQKPQASYGLYADFYWYEIGDVICIGNKDALYYCFPKKKCSVAKARIAAEELYKISKSNSRIKNTDTSN